METTSNCSSRNRGSVLIEAIVGSAVCLTVLLGVLGTFGAVSKMSRANTAGVQAAYLEEEALEAVRILRDTSWIANIASQTPGASFYLTFDGSTWKATTTNAYIANSFERRVVIDNVSRDGAQNIVISGGTLDPKTKKVTVFVSWSTRGVTTTRSLSTYLTNIFNN